jgi:hypothetical protein
VPWAISLRFNTVTPPSRSVSIYVPAGFSGETDPAYRPGFLKSRNEFNAPRKRSLTVANLQLLLSSATRT